MPPSQDQVAFDTSTVRDILVPSAQLAAAIKDQVPGCTPQAAPAQPAAAAGQPAGEPAQPGGAAPVDGSGAGAPVVTAQGAGGARRLLRKQR